ncbi:hypothetical protein TNCT_355721 [Trichonephila clavata]|uniref:Uncharacterized protein n=1 Tax=Trichonephila clavata TaxID=2740835 RepID=A0A8X6LKR6_TRICU|nr:hypothetical protein TNCT_355721 [Trichonephila clavata]
MTLLAFINQTWKESLASAWRKAKSYHTILKPNKPAENIDSYRPISLTNIITTPTKPEDSWLQLLTSIVSAVCSEFNEELGEELCVKEHVKSPVGEVYKSGKQCVLGP